MAKWQRRPLHIIESPRAPPHPPPHDILLLKAVLALAREVLIRTTPRKGIGFQARH